MIVKNPHAVAPTSRLRPCDITVTHEPPDGWWIDLPFGWIMDDGTHGIVEDTKREALAKLVLATPCDCVDCTRKVK
jgi:hypothetical protein